VETLCDGLARQGAFIAAQEVLTWPDVRRRCAMVSPCPVCTVLYERLGMASACAGIGSWGTVRGGLR